MKPLLKTMGALPFFLSVFLNAFVDLGHKITIQNTVFKLYSEQHQIVATAILNALILLPFIILLSPAGFISDRFKRTQVMRGSAWAVVGLCGLVWLSYVNGWFWISFFATFALAVQSAIYSPAKLAFVKEMFGKERLAEANGVVASLSILAILISTFAFSITFENYFHADLTNEAEILKAVAPIGMLLTMTAVLELFCMYRLPLQPEFTQASPKTTQFDWSAFFTGRLFSRDLQPLKEQKAIRLAVFGLAGFWGVGQVMLAAFPAYFKSTTNIDNTIVIQGILACSGVGIALGAFLAGKISKNKIELGVLPIAALGIAVGLLFLPLTTTPVAAALDFFLIGICGGLFIVPLNALIQFLAKSGELGKTLAANNWVQNITMFSFLVMTVSFAVLELSSQTLLTVIAIVASLGAIYTWYQLPQDFVRLIMMTLLRIRYRADIRSLENLPAKGGALLLGNHVTWIDWAIVQLASPRPVRFVMARSIYSQWYLKWLFDLAGCIPIEPGPNSQIALDIIRQRLEAGEVVCLFPEGGLTRNGQLKEFKRGFERACKGLSKDVPIIPFYMHGLWGSRFSYSPKRFIQRPSKGIRREIVLTFGEALTNTISASELKQSIFEFSIRFEQSDETESEYLEDHNQQTPKPQNQSLASDKEQAQNLTAAS